MFSLFMCLPLAPPTPLPRDGNLCLCAQINTQEDGNTALTLGAEFGHEAVVDKLLTHGAAVDHVDVSWVTPFPLPTPVGFFFAPVHRLLVMHLLDPVCPITNPTPLSAFTHLAWIVLGCRPRAALR